MKTTPSLRRVHWTTLIGTVALLASTLAITRDSLSAELPRYKLQVGQELVYRTPDVPKTEKPQQPDDAKPKRERREIIEEYLVTVTGQNGDGSWRLAFRNNLNYGGNDRWNGGYFDMAADGKITGAGTLSVMAQPLAVFPPLPALASATTWSGTAPIDEMRRDCTAASPPAATDNEWSFVEDHHNVFTPIYELSDAREYVFDVEKGLVTRVTRRAKQGWPAGRADDTPPMTVALVSSRQLESSELAEFKSDMDQYNAAKAEHDQIEATKTFKNTAEIADKSLEPLKALQGRLRSEFFKSMLSQQLKQTSDYRKYELEEAERFAKLIDQPSQDWKTTDLDGHARTLADYRGKVVLLDFWYRGCGWCIRAMPQFKQLVDDFADQPVAILGMNSDQNVDDARWVIDKMRLNYVTLKNGEADEAINRKYGVQGWPTLVVLDQQGVIRHIHVGYSPKLRKELGDKIRELLASKPAAK